MYIERIDGGGDSGRNRRERRERFHRSHRLGKGKPLGWLRAKKHKAKRARKYASRFR